MPTKKELQAALDRIHQQLVEAARRGGIIGSSMLTKEQRIARARKAGLASAAASKKRKQEAAKLKGREGKRQ